MRGVKKRRHESWKREEIIEEGKRRGENKWAERGTDRRKEEQRGEGRKKERRRKAGEESKEEERVWSLICRAGRRVEPETDFLSGDVRRGKRRNKRGRETRKEQRRRAKRRARSSVGAEPRLKQILDADLKQAKKSYWIKWLCIKLYRTIVILKLLNLNESDIHEL